MSISPPIGSLVILLGTCLAAHAQQVSDTLPAPLETPLSQSSYGIGVQMGRNLVQSGLDAELVDPAALLAGIQDALAEKEPRVSQADFQAAMSQVQQMAQAKLQRKMDGMGEKNRREGPEFIKKYQAVAGVKMLPNGPYYRVLKAGNGPTPKRTDMVRTHYRGRFVDGAEFDSSYSREEPAVFPVAGVIKGWTDALLQMKVGDRWEIVVPSELAYGKQGSPPVIGPDAVLVFEIELLAIEPPQDVPATVPGAEPTP